MKTSKLLKMSKIEWALLIWTGVLLAAAVFVKQLQLGETASSTIGLFEVFLAAVTGVAVGLAASFNKQRPGTDPH